MIEVKNISYAYGKTEVLKDISFKVEPGQCVGILGNNGCGKSTLITCINKIRTPKTGNVYIDSKDTREMNRNQTARLISYVAQKNEANQITVFDSVLMGRKPYMKWTVSQNDIDICNQAIEQVGMPDFKLRYINELSGGELQKVTLARAFAQQPRLMLLDEPTSSLDPKNQHEMLALVRKMVDERNISVLVVLHDVSLALHYCDKFLFMKSGSVYAYGDESVVTKETMRDVYGVDATVTEVGGRRIAIINCCH